MKGLWDDIDGERWLENPQLILANPRKGSTMAKSYRRRRGRKHSPRRKRVRRNYAASGLIAANPKRRRHRRQRYSLNAHRRHRRIRRHRIHRRHFRRNPALMGFQLPPLDAVIWTGAGFIIPPIVTSYAMKWLPDTWKANKIAYYGVKAASVLIPSMLVKRFVSQRAGNFMLVGGAASFAIDLIREFAPGLLPGPLAGQPFLGFYERMPLRVPTSTGMGRYASLPVRSVPLQRTPLVSMTPERLVPANRF